MVSADLIRETDRPHRLGDAVLALAVTNALLAVTGRMSLPG
jgi:hypothetical protein